jgi:hypothetical protein
VSLEIAAAELVAKLVKLNPETKRKIVAVVAAAVAGLALALTFTLLTHQRDSARTLAEGRRVEMVGLKGKIAGLISERDAALRAKAAAEKDLKDYASKSLAAYREQAAAAQRWANTLSTLSRRQRTASKEIGLADGTLRLDDVMPSRVRDALACSRGDDRACAATAAADPGGVPGGAAKPGAQAGAASPGADLPRGAPSGSR